MESIACQLQDRSFAVVDGFLSARLREALAAEVGALRSQGALKRAGVGSGQGLRQDDAVRRDATVWLTPGGEPGHPELWDKLEGLRHALNRDLFLGLNAFEGHYAVYEPGAFYRRHFDRFSDNLNRTVSCVLYLNAAWSEADEGALRLYPPGQPPVDVLPLPGRLACFLSHDIEHEVLAPRRERLSIAGWFLRSPVGWLAR